MQLSELTKAGKYVEKISVATYFEKYATIPVIDVRSPGEFAKAHIRGAHSIPLFNNEERAIIGTAYKQESREKAIELGFDMVQPKLASFITDAKKIAPNGEIIVHCWRGGMRSAAFARHLSMNGFSKVRVIEGGYKAFRKHVLNFFKRPFKLVILGGYTGSGKTEILKELKKKGLQVIDLEGLANHRGSAFGGIDLPPQPSVEHFENQLFHQLSQFDLQHPIWIEDESIHIGSVFIPMDFFKQMKNHNLYFLNIKRDERVKHLVNMYAGLNSTGLETSIGKIAKRLGYNHAKEATDLLHQKEYDKVAHLCLTYYDKLYKKGMKMRDPEKVIEIELPDTSPLRNAEKLIKTVKVKN